MMKKNLILAAVLILLVGLAFAYQGPIKRWQADLGKPKNFLSAINTDKLDKIVVSGARETTLVREDAGWLVEGSKFKAADTVMTDLLEKLNKATSAQIEFVSTNKNKKSDFKTDSSGTNVKFYSGGKELLSVVIGKNGPNYNSTYISQPEIDATYLLLGENLSYVFAKDDWRDKSIMSFDKAKISKVRFQYVNREFAVEKKDDKWAVTGSKNLFLNKDKIDKVISALAGLSAVNIPEQDFAPTGLDKGPIIIQVTGEGIDQTIMIGKDNGKSEFYAKNGASDNIYLIDKTTHDALDQTIEKLK